MRMISALSGLLQTGYNKADNSHLRMTTLKEC